MGCGGMVVVVAVAVAAVTRVQTAPVAQTQHAGLGAPDSFDLFYPQLPGSPASSQAAVPVIHLPDMPGDIGKVKTSHLYLYLNEKEYKKVIWMSF